MADRILDCTEVKTAMEWNANAECSLAEGDTTRMGLAERRIIQKFQNEIFPGLKKRIDDAAGFEVPLEVDWEKLAQPDIEGMGLPSQSQRYMELWPGVYFEPLIQSLEEICADDLGKQALKDSLKQVEITRSEPEAADSISFTNGVLRIDHKFVNAHAVTPRKDAIVALMEKAL